MRHPATSIRRIVSAAVLLVVLGAFPAAAGTSSPAGEPAPQGMAVFEWYRLSQVNTYVTAQRLSSLRREGFSTIYADIGEYLEAADQPQSWRQQRQLSRLAGDLRRFVARASSLGFAVHAVAGGPSWTAESHRYLGPMTLQLIADYNRNAYPQERLQGVQFDIEPYVEDSFWENVEVSLSDYLATLQGIIKRYNELESQDDSDGLALGFAIPFWFDGTPEVPEVQFGGGAKKAAAFHLIDMLRRLPQAYVLVMAYRNVASGIDGSIALAKAEFDYAYASGNPEVACACGIVVGQEFTDVTPEPEKLSFWTTGRVAFRQAVAALTEAYGGLPQFRGVSVDDIDAYEAAGEYGRRRRR
jgi:hypothetical protein